MISTKRMEEIVADLNKSRFEKRYMSEEESLEALSNLGNEETEVEESEDY